YGRTDTYYGTVEQQRWLTLHMHMLICNHSSSELSIGIHHPFTNFLRSQGTLDPYLESCHVGEFFTGTIANVRAKFPSSRLPASIHEKKLAPPSNPATCTSWAPPLCSECKNLSSRCTTCINIEN
ncbi:hypothetical protein C8R45DRAFT_848828, partial [Mycena sanguinolenta]